MKTIEVERCKPTTAGFGGCPHCRLIHGNVWASGAYVQECLLELREIPDERRKFPRWCPLKKGGVLVILADS